MRPVDLPEHLIGDRALFMFKIIRYEGDSEFGWAHRLPNIANSRGLHILPETIGSITTRRRLTLRRWKGHIFAVIISRRQAKMHFISCTMSANYKSGLPR